MAAWQGRSSQSLGAYRLGGKVTRGRPVPEMCWACVELTLAVAEALTDAGGFSLLGRSSEPGIIM